MVISSFSSTKWGCPGWLGVAAVAAVAAVARLAVCSYRTAASANWEEESIAASLVLAQTPAECWEW